MESVDNKGMFIWMWMQELSDINYSTISYMYLATCHVRDITIHRHNTGTAPGKWPSKGDITHPVVFTSTLDSSANRVLSLLTTILISSSFPLQVHLFHSIHHQNTHYYDSCTKWSSSRCVLMAYLTIAHHCLYQERRVAHGVLPSGAQSVRADEDRPLHTCHKHSPLAEKKKKGTGQVRKRKEICKTTTAHTC